MNYHYRPNSKQQQIYKQLNKVDNEINNHKRQLDRRKLEAQFYEDKKESIQYNNLNLADQIMNQLISVNNPPNPTYIKKQFKQPPPIPQIRKDQYKQNAFNIPPPQPRQRQNLFINQRQIQKNKLQNQKHEGFFPNSNDRNRIRSYGKQQPQLIPQKDKIEQKVSPYSINPNLMKNKSPEIDKNYNPNYNPFVRADEIEKQKKEQRHREYLRQLELQRQQQQRKKQQRDRQKREIKGQFYDFLPSKNTIQEKPLVMKKNDPNSRPPKIQQPIGNYSQFDGNLIKLKADQVKTKYKKGKISYEEYQRELNNLRKHYNGDFDQLISDKINTNRVQKSPQKQIIIQQSKSIREESPKKQSYAQYEKKIQYNNNYHPNLLKNQSINHSVFVNSMVPPQQQHRSNLNYSIPQQNTSFIPSGIPIQYVQMMKKMFETCLKEVREAYSQRIMHQDQILHQTLNRFMQNAQGNFLTQNINPIPPIHGSQQQRQFYSDAKQIKQYFDKQSNIKKRINVSGESLSNIPFGESDNSQYYDKSLSAIASKIPFNNHSAPKIKIKTEEKEDPGIKMQQFFTKKYKVKPLKKLPKSTNQRQQQIPSTSTYYHANNALQQLNSRFNQDLQQLRKLKIQKDVNKLSKKMEKNTLYSTERRILNDPGPQLVSGGNIHLSKSPLNRLQSQQNMFLKKHVSNDENMMTFNQNQLRINSPINKYSPKSKKQILEQDQYQTEPKIRDEGQKVPNYIQQYEQRLNFPNKALNFIKKNNEILSKYEKTQESKKQLIIIRDSSNTKEKQSNYFTNNDISPVKKSQNYYQESLQTIRSDFESANYSKKPIKPTDNNKDEQNYKNKSKKSAQKQKQKQEPQFISGEIGGYSQTIQSVEESSAKHSRPPVAKRRTLSRKKQSSIARSKANYESSISKGYNQDSIYELQAPKFDSNVYESQYQESLQLAKQRNRKPNPQIILNQRHEDEQISTPNIQIYVPTIITPKSAIQIQNSNFNFQTKNSKIAPQNKLKSLEQARKHAKQYRVKATDESKQYKSVEQHFSQLESYITKRGDQSSHNIRRDQPQKLRQKSKQKSVKGKKDIMKMLEQLQDYDNEEYKQQFDSYRQQSEQYQ